MTMRPIFLFAIFAVLASVAACGGMNRAVTTVPRTFDSLGDKTAPLRGERSPEERPVGEAALR